MTSDVSVASAGLVGTYGQAWEFRERYANFPAVIFLRGHKKASPAMKAVAMEYFQACMA